MPKKTPSYRPFGTLRAPSKARRERPRSFAEVMARVGAVRLSADKVRVPPPQRLAQAPIAAPSVPEFSLVRDDDWIEGYRSGLPARVRERLRAVPAAELDLHRLDAATARRRVARFLASERARGRETVLLVVGRGRHSPGGRAVLRGELAGWLTTMPCASNVLAFRTAPRALGGPGAVVVLLAPARPVAPSAP